MSAYCTPAGVESPVCNPRVGADLLGGTGQEGQVTRQGHVNAASGPHASMDSAAMGVRIIVQACLPTVAMPRSQVVVSQVAGTVQTS